MKAFVIDERTKEARYLQFKFQDHRLYLRKYESEKAEDSFVFPEFHTEDAGDTREDAGPRC